jgi:hypothetical protein
MTDFGDLVKPRVANCQRQPKTDPLAAVASSSDRKIRGPEDLIRSLPSQPLSRPVIELIDDGLDLISVVD